MQLSTTSDSAVAKKVTFSKTTNYTAELQLHMRYLFLPKNTISYIFSEFLLQIKQNLQQFYFEKL